MITCRLETDFSEELYQIFLLENLKSERAECEIKKGKALVFMLKSKDAIGMKALINSILNVIETYNKIK
jgi:tRNA threonylcarbamoyladenosine modification (KEOPS) complex  Pcc1 subunit